MDHLIRGESEDRVLPQLAQAVKEQAGKPVTVEFLTGGAGGDMLVSSATATCLVELKIARSRSLTFATLSRLADLRDALGSGQPANRTTALLVLVGALPTKSALSIAQMVGVEVERADSVPEVADLVLKRL